MSKETRWPGLSIVPLPASGGDMHEYILAVCATDEAEAALCNPGFNRALVHRCFRLSAIVPRRALTTCEHRPEP